MGFRIVDRNSVGDLLKNDRLTGLRRRNDKSALSLADGANQVDNTGRNSLRRSLQPQLLVRIQRGQVLELRALMGLLGRQPVSRIQANQGIVLLPPSFALARLAHRTLDRIAGAQPPAAHLPQ